MPESGHGANAGLVWAIEELQKIHAKHPDISYGDLYQLASVYAIEHAGGPKIPFRMGRADVNDESCTPDGRLPDGMRCPVPSCLRFPVLGSTLPLG